MTGPEDDRLARIAAAFVDMFDPEAPPRLFGDWRQPLTQALKPTPVGAHCFVCDVSIVKGDTGEFMTTRKGYSVPFHVECLILLFKAHDLRVCAHHNYAGCVNDDGSPNLREAALVAAERLGAGPDLLPWARPARSRGEPS